MNSFEPELNSDHDDLDLPVASCKSEVKESYIILIADLEFLYISKSCVV